MRSLFFKIFLYFLLTILLVSSLVFLLTYLRDREFPPLAYQDFARKAIAEYGRDAINEYEQNGLTALGRFVGSLRDKSGIILVLFDGQGQPLTGRQVPRRMHHMAHRALHSGEVVFPMRGARNGLAALVKARSGANYVVAIALPGGAPKHRLFTELTHGFLGWRLLILLTVTAVICYLLARSLTSPIGRLRQATRRFANGDLSVRVGDRIKGNDEIVGLARDFDDMAIKIQALVGSQKRLLRDISHELRSPLTRLGIALELARKNDNQEERKSFFDRIELESERMNEMIGQLLELTRLESGSGKVERQPLDLKLLLQDLVRDAGFEAESRNCRVCLDVTKEPLIITGSVELLKQALENVIRNAVKYTENGTLVEVVGTQKSGQVIIRICDCGPGVPEESLKKLFDPFYRVADARERESGGTGIGLAIAERSIHLHGGSIKAMNRSQGGLEVEIVLPVKG